MNESNQHAIEGLRRLISRLNDAQNQQLAQEIRTEIARDLERAIRRAWSQNRSPNGEPWRGKFGSVDLNRSGALRRSLVVRVTERGVDISMDGGKTFGRHSLASVHQYGGNVRARFRGSRSKAFQGASIGAHAGRALGAKPMRFYSGGHWWAKYTVRVPPTPLLPDSGTMPPEWGEAVEEAMQRVLARWAGSAGLSVVS